MKNIYTKEGSNVAIRTEKGDIVVGVKDGQTYVYLASNGSATKTYTFTEVKETLEESGIA